MIHSEPPAADRDPRLDVTLFVSAGPKLAKVPVLVGSQRRLAVQQIRGRGLDPSVSEEESNSPAGEVISQSPSAGSEVEAGLDRGDRRLLRQEAGEGAERDRQAALAKRWRRSAPPGSPRPSKKKKPKSPARSAA